MLNQVNSNNPEIILCDSETCRWNIEKSSGVKTSNIKFVSLLAAPEGIKNLKKQHQKLHLFTCSVDKGLNKNKFIVPGLGDAGDRYMGT